MAIWVNIYILLCKASGALPLNLRHCIVIPSPLLVSASTLKNLLMVKILLLVLYLHCLHSSKAFGQEPLKPFCVSHASIRKESLARNLHGTDDPWIGKSSAIRARIEYLGALVYVTTNGSQYQPGIEINWSSFAFHRLSRGQWIWVSVA